MTVPALPIQALPEQVSLVQVLPILTILVQAILTHIFLAKKAISAKEFITAIEVVISEKILGNAQEFNSCFVNKIRNPCIKKAYEKTRPVIQTPHDKVENLMLR